MVKIHVETCGRASDPSMLLLHGWAQEGAALSPLAQLLAKQVRSHLVDLPGFGLSEAPQKTWDSFDYADCLIDYLNAHQIEKADFLGHSFGGKIALSVAIKYPERTRKLILISSAGLQRRRSAVEKMQRIAVKYSGKFIKQFDKWQGSTLFTDYFIPRFGSTDYQKAGPMRSILVRSVNEDLATQIRKIKSPTLILWGTNDPETPLEMAYRLHQSISCSTLVALPHKGHTPFLDVGAHLCAYYIRGFLEKS